MWEMKKGGSLTFAVNPKQRTRFPFPFRERISVEKTIPRFRHGGPYVQCYDSLMDLEEITTVETFPGTGHL